MLYTTTRNRNASYTAYRALTEDRAPDGGLYIPHKLPAYSNEELSNLKIQSFGEIVASVLNLFFSAKITGWDVDCIIGKEPVRIKTLHRRMYFAQLWNNPAGKYTYICNGLYKRICQDEAVDTPSNWALVAIRIAIVFGIILRDEQFRDAVPDISLIGADFTDVMAVWYARTMGLPIGTIICACNENSTPWDFLHKGELNTGVSVVHTGDDCMDVPVPTGLERLICHTLGHQEACAFALACENGDTYHVPQTALPILNEGFRVCVVGSDRISPVMNSVFRTTQYLLDPYTAAAYGAIQDYRYKVGESRPTLFLCDYAPTHYKKRLSAATGLPEERIAEYY